MMRFWFIALLCVLGCKAQAQSIEQITDEPYWGIVEDFTFTPDGSKIIIVGDYGRFPCITIIDTSGNLLLFKSYDWFPGGMDPGPATFSKVVCDTNGYFYVSGYSDSENYWPESFLVRFDMQGDSSWFCILNEGHAGGGAPSQAMFIEDNKLLVLHTQPPASFQIFDSLSTRPVLKKMISADKIPGAFWLGNYAYPRTVFKNDSMFVVHNWEGDVFGLNIDTFQILGEKKVPENTSLFGFDGESYYAGRFFLHQSPPPSKDIQA